MTFVRPGAREIHAVLHFSLAVFLREPRTHPSFVALQ